MPDYDPKNIPVLDDIIDEVDDALDGSGIETGNTESNNATEISDENMLDMFANKDTDDHAVTSDAFSYSIHDDRTEDDEPINEPTIESSNAPTDASNDETDYVENEVADNEIVESALIDFQNEDDNADSIQPTAYSANNTADDVTVDATEDMAVEAITNISVIEEQDSQSQVVDTQSETCTPAPTLDSIADDIVSQLMPTLEQQLRQLVQQALNEKLSADILKSLSTGTSSDSTE